MPRLCEAQAGAGAAVRLLTTQPADEQQAIWPSHPVQAITVPEESGIAGAFKQAYAFHGAVCTHLRSGTVDLVHDHGLWLPIHPAVTLAVRCAGGKLVIGPKGMLMPWALEYKPGRKRVTWWAYQRWVLTSADMLHASSTAEADAIRDLGFTQPIATVPYGIHIPPLTQSSTRERSEANNQRVALFLSRIHPVKGIPMLLDAWAAVRRPGWRLVIAGPDEEGHRDELETQCDCLGIRSNVEFIGAVDNEKKWSLMSAADLFVLPTYTENFGIVVPEALGSGTPVITTTGAPWQDLETYNCGWWVNPTTDAIRTALSAALSCSDKERASMGQRGRRLVEKKYTWASVGEQMVAAYQWLLGTGDRPACVQISE